MESREDLAKLREIPVAVRDQLHSFDWMMTL